MNYKTLLLLVSVFTGVRCVAQTTVKFNDPHIRYMGRIAMRDSAAELSWSASDVKVSFSGTSVSAVLRDERSDNNYNVIIDDSVMSVLHPLAEKKEYVLASGLKEGEHTLELFKRTEWAMGKTWLYSISADGKLLPPPPVPERKMEFYGNSITCGYADIDTTGQDRGTSPFENGYISYAELTARHYNAELYNISKSGIGITVSWFPLIMPEMYDRLDATDPDSKWDFSKYTPDIVVINLFQNDSWIVNLHDNDQFKARFGDKPPTPDFIIKSYRSFVKSVREKYPKAKIICMLGSMDATKTGSPWPIYINKAVDALNDKNIFTHFIPYKGTNGHPSAKEQQDMANNLIAFIDENIKW
ncbi:MAG TPA: SGNH/GDSL hydrolase family protein [Mucilaginibacter sp.]|nr:SGNH/GDSL hydrolase family protein [Mucilaginibacter sp.]